MWLEVIKAISKLGSYEASRTILHVLSFFHQMTECGGNLGPRIICLSFKIEGIWTLILYNRVSKLVYNIQEKNKTTTTTLTYEIMHKAYGDRVHLVGNIGYPFCNVLDKLKKDDFIVMEVSVQQSVNIDKFHPHVALLTNFSPAHIDFLGTYEKYKKTKAKMCYNQ